ncbi:MAG: M20/M25/M40 family metallo-hydrolase [Gemmatimonadales bacterium]
MRLIRRVFLAACCAAPVTAPAAQTFPTADPVLRRIWTEGMDQSQAMALLQVLSDSIGPRFTASSGIMAGQDWLKATYAKWGVTARSERYGTWTGWRRGVTHLDLLAPRVRSLDATMLTLSPGTRGRPLEGGPVVMAESVDSAALQRWLPTVKGKFVLVSYPEPTCRPDSSYVRWAGREAFGRMDSARESARRSWARRWPAGAAEQYALAKRLEAAGAIGLVESSWTGGWGAYRVVHMSRTTQIPSVVLSCEDYGLVHRLAEQNQGPRLRLTADGELLGDVPVFNVVAEMRGSQKPDEYVMLSAHFDSWDGASGTTDNGTGTILMLEAMRILKAAYPSPKRTILVGHWSGEEQGLNGSHAFVEDHPEVLRGLHALFNQDNGTGRIASFSAVGLVNAGAQVGAWFSKLPAELSRNVQLGLPGFAGGGGTDNASFACAGAPGFGLGSENADYGEQTWHTIRDTYDKAIPENVKSNATLVAMLAYLASEDATLTPRERRELAIVNGRQQEWPTCAKAARSRAESSR